MEFFKKMPLFKQHPVITSSHNEIRLWVLMPSDIKLVNVTFTVCNHYYATLGQLRCQRTSIIIAFQPAHAFLLLNGERLAQRHLSVFVIRARPRLGRIYSQNKSLIFGHQ